MRAGELRADALRNREALLAAAQNVMGERGLDAPLDEIATRAGLGNATLYRHFPTRIDLIVAVFADRIAEHLRVVEEALAEPDAWLAFRRYISAMAASQVRDRSIADLVTMEIPTAPDIERARIRALRGVAVLIERAKAAGDIRQDCTIEDVLLVFQANAGVIERSNRASSVASQRLVHVLLDGLRSDAATPGPCPPSARRIRAAMRERSRRLGFGPRTRDA